LALLDLAAVLPADLHHPTMQGVPRQRTADDAPDVGGDALTRSSLVPVSASEISAERSAAGV